MAPHPEPASFPKGHKVDQRYEIVQELGRGGFGRAYKAKDHGRFKEPCVLKEFIPAIEIQQNPQDLAKAKELFDREAAILYQLDHPQIPKFRELCCTTFHNQQRWLLVQDWVPGNNYGGRRLTEAQTMQWIWDLLPVLAYLHNRPQPVIHRDISPDNVVEGTVNGKKMPVLVDFGAVKQLASTSLARPGTIIGKKGYAPPEQGAGRPCPASDLYSLGISAWVLLTGKQPDDFQAQGSRWKQVGLTLSPGFVKILEKLTDEKLGSRYQNAAQVQTDLKPLLSSAPGPKTQPVVPSAPQPHRSKDPVSYFDWDRFHQKGDWARDLWQRLTDPAVQRYGRQVGLAAGTIVVMVVAVAWGSQWIQQRGNASEGGSTATTEPGGTPGTEGCSTEDIWKRYEALDRRATVPDLSPTIDDRFYQKFPEKVVNGERQSIQPEETRYIKAWCDLADQWLTDQGG